MKQSTSKKEKLEEEKLALEIKELKKPWWKQTSYLTILATFISIMTGIITGYIDVKKMEIGYEDKIKSLNSGFKKDSILLDNKIIEKEKTLNTLKQNNGKLEQTLISANQSLKNSINQKEVLKKEILKKTITLKNLSKKDSEEVLKLNLAIEKEKRILESTKIWNQRFSILSKKHKTLSSDVNFYLSELPMCLKLKSFKSDEERFKCLVSNTLKWRKVFDEDSDSEKKLLEDFDKLTNETIKELKSEYKNKSRFEDLGIDKYNLEIVGLSNGLTFAISDYYNREYQKIYNDMVLQIEN
jgi:hypothetical protein